MEFRDILDKRVSVRRFKNTKITEAQINALMQAAMRAPSAVNRNPWKFIVVENEDKLKELKGASRYTGYDAPLAIIVCGDPERFLAEPNDSYWIQDCSAATENILLACVNEGLGAVWCGIHPQEDAVANVRNMLDLGELIQLHVISVGVPQNEPVAKDRFEEDRIVYVK